VVFYTLQTAVFSQTPLISGTADLILLFLAAWSLQEQVKNSWLWTIIAGFLISTASAMPYYTPLIGYLGVVGISKLLQRQVWRSPILVMFIVTLLGTFFQHSLYIIMLQVSGAPTPWSVSLDHIVLPSLLLNLIFALPVYAIVNDLVGRIYPLEVET
jgi:cell shape-determining protein MreD